MNSNDVVEVLAELQHFIGSKTWRLDLNTAQKAIDVIEQFKSEIAELDEIRLKEQEETEELIVGMLTEVGTICSGPWIRKARERYGL